MYKTWWIDENKKSGVRYFKSKHDEFYLIEIKNKDSSEGNVEQL